MIAVAEQEHMLKMMHLKSMFDSAGIGSLDASVSYAQWLLELRRIAYIVEQAGLRDVHFLLSPSFFEFIMRCYDKAPVIKTVKDAYKPVLIKLGVLLCRPGHRMNWFGRAPFKVTV